MSGSVSHALFAVSTDTNLTAVEVRVYWNCAHRTKAEVVSGGKVVSTIWLP
jgi:hypothetical protein